MSARVEKLRELVEPLEKWPTFEKSGIQKEIDRLTVIENIASSYVNDINVENIFRFKTGMKIQDMRINIDEVINIYKTICNSCKKIGEFNKFLNEVNDTGDDLSDVAFAKAIYDCFIRINKKFGYFSKIDVKLLENYNEKIAFPINVFISSIGFEYAFDRKYAYRLRKKREEIQVNLSTTKIIYDREKAQKKREPDEIKVDKAKKKADKASKVLSIVTVILGYIACAMIGIMTASAAESIIVLGIVGITFAVFYSALVWPKFSDLEAWWHDKFNIPNLPSIEFYAKDEITARVLAVRSTYDKVGEDVNAIKQITLTSNNINSIYEMIDNRLKFSLEDIDDYCRLFINGTVTTIEEAAEYCKIKGKLIEEAKEREKRSKEYMDAWNKIIAAKERQKEEERHREEFKSALANAITAEKERNKTLGEIRDSLNDLKDYLD